MISLAKLSIRRPKASLIAWLITGIVLSLIGLGVSKSLSPSITVVPGTQSSRAQQLGNAQFGPTQLVPILLVGPKPQLDRQGPVLVAALAKRPHTRVMSAWDAGSAAASLRPKPTAAMIVVSVDRSEKDAVKYDQPQIESLVAHEITGQVRPYISGQPSIDRAEKNAALSSLRRDEAIAIGILFLLLLIGLRAPVAAVIVTATGAISMLAGFGEVALLGKIFALDPVGVAAGTMTGLAVAVGFALLILDRFHREEFPPGAHPRDAVTAAVRGLETTGKAVLVAGTALVLALALVAVIGPTQLMVSVGTGALTCALFATGGAVVVMPAALVLLGKKIDWLKFPAPAFLVRAWSALVDGGNRVVRHAVYAGFVATAVLAAIAVPALALKSGPPDISQLPSGSKAVIAFNEISRVMGPGWATPYNMIVVSNDLPITTPKMLASLSAFQLQVAKNKTVDSVTGPGAINPTSKQLATFGPQLNHSAAVSEKSKKDLITLINGLGLGGLRLGAAPVGARRRLLGRRTTAQRRRPGAVGRRTAAHRPRPGKGGFGEARRRAEPGAFRRERPQERCGSGARRRKPARRRARQGRAPGDRRAAGRRYACHRPAPPRRMRSRHCRHRLAARRARLPARCPRCRRRAARSPPRPAARAPSAACRALRIR